MGRELRALLLTVKKESESARINRESQEWNKTHKEECSYFNWLRRMEKAVDKGLKIWPNPSEREIKAFEEEREKRRKWGIL